MQGQADRHFYGLRKRRARPAGGGQRGSVPPAFSRDLDPHRERSSQYRLGGRPRGLVECRRSDRPDQQGHANPREQIREVVHSITWSARSSSDGGIVSPRALAVLRLMTNSNFVGCSMGRSPGLVPLRILST